MIRFSLFGIPITIEPWHWIFLLIIGSGLGKNFGGNDQMLAVALFVIAGSFSILVHELGHALTIKSFGFPTAITLTTMGGYAIYPAGVATRWQQILITAAGPFAQLVLALISWLMLQYLDFPTDMARILVYFLHIVSLYWSLLNLIPVIPLDGGMLMAHFLGPKHYRIALKISILCSIIGGLLLFNFLGSFIFPIFLGFYAWQNYRVLQN